jgi:EAL domain-containing protein (putative c-di-GMP-specific phosphodiesterase class I)/GGDEF domain-containing protein
MSRFVQLLRSHFARPGAAAVFAVFICGFAPLVLLLTLSPDRISLWASYAIAAICASLATILLRTPAQSWAWNILGAKNQAHDLDAANENELGGGALQGPGALASILSKELTAGRGPSLLGVIRIANYDRMAAFDVAMADRFIAAFHQRLEAALGKTRHLAWVERNCFAIWFGHHATVSGAQAELKALSYALTQSISDDRFTIEPELEIGSAETGPASESPQELLSRALASLSKTVPSGNAAESAPPVPADLRRRFTLEQDLRHAISNGELELHYQPFIDTAACRVTGAEALLRWKHPQLGAISPLEFVPILEDTGLMHDVGIWVLNTACRQLREWRVAGQTDFRMAINLSAKQLRNPALKTIIERTVQNHNLSPADIEIELTETAAMEESGLTLELFRELRKAGFGLAIDDFGSGYSSLSYLKNLPFSKLKIDREFVTRVDQRSVSRAICKALMQLASGLGISVLAEGVERREEVEMLHRMGCTQFQGFYFAKGMPPALFAQTTLDAAWLATISAATAPMQINLKALGS